MASSVAARSAPAVARRGDEPVPGYRLLERVGIGGSGEVWRAEAPGGLLVALKLIPIAGKLGSRERSTLGILRAVRHPNLLTYFGAWTTDDLLIIGMELADRSLWDRWQEFAEQGFAGIPRTELLEALGEAAEVIDFLHEPRHELDGRPGAAILHRDIKPQNLMLVGRGVKVADFGLSTLIGQDATSPSHAGLTYSYAAPETFRGQIRRQSDQYSLAVTYCVLRGGRPPFAGPPGIVMAGHMFQPADLSMLPEPERPIVARALGKEPAARWPDCRQFIAALESCTAAGVPETMPRARPDGDDQEPLAGESAFLMSGVILPSETPTALLDDSWSPGDPSAYLVGSSVVAQAPSPSPEPSSAVSARITSYL